MTTGKIAAGAANSNVVADESLQSPDLGTNSVGSSEVLDESVGAAEIDEGKLDTGQALTAAKRGETTIPNEGSATLVSRDAPAGSYLLFGQVVLQNKDPDDGGEIGCYIRADGNILGPNQGRYFLAEPHDGADMRVLALHTALVTERPVNLDIRCEETGAASPMVAERARLVALRLRAIE